MLDRNLMKSNVEHGVIVHDFGNLQSQVIFTSWSLGDCKDIADKLNFLFANAGDSGKYNAETFSDDLTECD